MFLLLPLKSARGGGHLRPPHLFNLICPLTLIFDTMVDSVKNQFAFSQNFASINKWQAIVFLRLFFQKQLLTIVFEKNHKK